MGYVQSMKAVNGNAEGISTVIGRYLYRRPRYNSNESTLTHANTDCSVYNWRGEKKKGSVCVMGNTLKSIIKIADCTELWVHYCKKWKKDKKRICFGSKHKDIHYCEEVGLEG